MQKTEHVVKNAATEVLSGTAFFIFCKFYSSEKTLSSLILSNIFIAL